MVAARPERPVVGKPAPIPAGKPDPAAKPDPGGRPDPGGKLDQQGDGRAVNGGEPVATTGPVADPEDDEGAERRPPRSNGSPRRPGPGGGPGEEREGERGLRGLVGSGSSQVSVGAALRARDAARPSDAQLADADENLVIVRRNWTPREELPRR